MGKGTDDGNKASTESGSVLCLGSGAKALGEEYWSGLPFPSPGDLPDSIFEPRSPAVQADSLLTELLEEPWR